MNLLKRKVDYKILPNNELIELKKKAIKGDYKARNIMLESVIPMILKLVRDYNLSGTDIDYEDLNQEMMIQGIKAIERWNYNKSRLTTHVYWAIRLQMISYVSSNNKDLIHVRKGVKKMVREWKPETDREEKLLIKAKICMNCIGGLTSDLDGYNLYEMRHPNGLENEDLFLSKEKISYCKKIINTLRYRERQIMQLRFGLSGNKEHILKDIGHKMGVTKERIRQIQKNCIQRLRDEQQYPF